MSLVMQNQGSGGFGDAPRRLLGRAGHFPMPARDSISHRHTVSAVDHSAEAPERAGESDTAQVVGSSAGLAAGVAAL